jgi:hypothetical protein
MRMRRLAMILAATALAACSSEPEPPQAPLAPIAPAAPQRLTAERIERIEIGRMFDGYAISVIGVFPGRGWSVPALRLVDASGAGADGFVDLELTAQVPPAGAAPDGETRLIAHALVRDAQTASARGARVAARAGAAEAPFRSAP